MPSTIYIKNIKSTDGSGIYQHMFNDDNHYQNSGKSLVIENAYVTCIDPDKDGIHIEGQNTAIVNKLYVDGIMSDHEAVDELGSIVNGADVIFYNCVFSRNGKGFLQGSGDSDILDCRKGQKTVFYKCYFKNNSRRNPFIQSGQSFIKKCVIENWGHPAYFDEKSYGIRIGKYAQAMIVDTVFIQDTLGKCLTRGNLLKDIFNQYFLPFCWLSPGFRNAAYADVGGQIVMYNCYRNRRWLYFENHRGPYMTEDYADQLINEMKELEKTLSNQ